MSWPAWAMEWAPISLLSACKITASFVEETDVLIYPSFHQSVPPEAEYVGISRNTGSRDNFHGRYSERTVPPALASLTVP